MAQRRSYSGNAPPTTLTADIDNQASTVTIPVTSVTGYPAGGVAGPFYIVIDRGSATEEKVLIESVSGLNMTAVAAVGRGADDTTRSSHLAGAPVEHVLTAVDLDEANDHVADVTNDDHTQYFNTARHAAASHVFGGALANPAAPEAVSQTTAATGDDTGPARADHVHVQAAATPRGVLGRTAHSTDVELTGSFADIVSVVVTLVAGRAYRVSGALQTFIADTGDNYIEVKLMEGATMYGRGSTQNGAFSTISDRIEMSAVVTGTGSTTFKFQALRGTAPSTSAAISSTAAPGYIMVEDIGAA